MSKVKDGNYVVIQSFMVKELKLKGNALLIYAIIYGFSQNGQTFNGSLQYLSDWTNCSKHSVLDNLKSLCAQGLIQKTEIEKNGVKFCEYRASEIEGVNEKFTTSEKSSMGVVKKVQWGSEESSPNNTADTIVDNTVNNNPPTPQGEVSKTSPKKKTIDYEAFRTVYNKTCTNPALSPCPKMTETRKKGIRRLLKDCNLEEWEIVCRKVNANKFMCGDNKSHWTADFDWLLKAGKAREILDHKEYNPHAKYTPPTTSEAERDPKTGIVFDNNCWNV